MKITIYNAYAEVNVIKYYYKNAVMTTIPTVHYCTVVIYCMCTW